MNTEFQLNENDIVYSIYSDIGELSFISFKPELHAGIIQRWLSLPYAHYWGMSDKSSEDLQSHYLNVIANNLATPYLGLVDGKPAFFIEVYDPETEGVTQHYAKRDGDCGMHILVSPADRPVAGFTHHIFMFVMEFLFSLPSVERVVVEPDHRNQKILKINKRAGFFHERKISLSGKDAYLAFCTRAQFSAAKKREAIFQDASDKMHFNPYASSITGITQIPSTASHAVDQDVWQKVNRLLVRKALSELSHERVLQPECSYWKKNAQCEYRVISEDQKSTYIFKAELLKLNHWLIAEDSIQRMVDGVNQPIDAVRFVLDFQTTLGIPQDKLPTYLEEITSTLCSSAFKYTKASLSAKELVTADFQQVEVAMNEGHPCFIANNGRIGFSSQDFLAYAPESGSPITLLWLAVHKSRAVFSCVEQTNYRQHIESELDVSTRDNFNEKLIELNLNVEDYFFIPVHPWQWFNKLATIYAPDVAARDVVCLGYGDDAYLAQQSIRTFYNISQPQKSYVKTALSILNMGFMRGLSSYYMRTTPAINTWVHQLIANDDYLQKRGFTALREYAAIGYSNPHYENEQVGNSPYKKMLAALWRENPMQYIEKGQSLKTMASLLHIDTQGNALLPELINASGLTTTQWLEKYFQAYLSPLLHCLYEHRLVFMPHGENLILCFENSVPVRAFMKDIGEEVCLLNSDTELPEDVRRISIKVPENEEVLAIFTDVFDCYFRFMAATLHEHSGFPEKSFWQAVAECVIAYQHEHPHLQPRFEQHDLFSDAFALSCLNRLQLKNNQQMVDLTDPSSSLQFSGTLENPISIFKPTRTRDTKEAENEQKA
ncbi:Aerobactin synthase [Thalassocella blandensis]|nr:Aerobactin synthase [Thalassocella blandensis]